MKIEEAKVGALIKYKDGRIALLIKTPSAGPRTAVELNRLLRTIDKREAEGISDDMLAEMWRRYKQLKEKQLYLVLFEQDSQIRSYDHLRDFEVVSP